MTVSKVSFLGLSIAVLLASIPFLIEARDRVITVDSLEKAYVSREKSLDAEIASTTKAADAIELTLSTSFNNPKATEKRRLLGNLLTLKEEKHMTETSYKLLQEALK